MSYPVLDPRIRESRRAGLCALAIMAKAPRPGKVKTRLSPPLTPEQAAALNTCFLRDTASNIAAVSAELPAAGVISYTPVGEEALFDGLLPPGFVLIPQRGEGFGERLLLTAMDLFACGYGAVCLVDSDSPTLPASALLAAVEALHAPGDRIVLGGSDDGGYYLIGMKLPHSAPFENIHWSTATVYAETVEQVRYAEIDLVELPRWYDVDDAASLAVLCAELLHAVAPPFAQRAGYAAQATRTYLETLKWATHSGVER